MKAENEKVVENFLLWGGVIVGGYFLILQPLLSNIGIDPASAAALKNEQNLPPSQNPFSPQFQPAVNSFNAAGVTDTNGNMMSMGSYYQALKSLYSQNNTTPTGNSAIDLIIIGAETINSALSPGFSLTTNESQIIGVFNSFSDQGQVSEMSAYFYYNFNNDLLTILNGSLFKQGLSPSNLAAVINHVNNLPATANETFGQLPGGGVDTSLLGAFGKYLGF